MYLSVYIGALRGHGLVSAKGGGAGALAGGGAGGRIALFSDYNNEYRGATLTQGGRGGGDTGGPGTVFAEDTLQRGQRWQSRLYVDGRGRGEDKPLVIYERNPRVVELGLENDNKADVSFDELMLTNEVSF